MHTQTVAPAQTLSPADLLENLLAKGGPVPADYRHVDRAVAALAEKIDRAEVAPHELGILLSKCGFLQSTDSIMGHIRLKPFGYAGDYAIIEKLYLNDVEAGQPFARWNRYALDHPAARAVRNRKDYFKRTLHDRLNARPEPSALQLLDVASGPARDLYELYRAIDPQRLETTCVEMDTRAIAHASALNQPYLDQIRFIEKNIFKFQTANSYDVIWSAGLFDYFNDKAFVMVLRKFRQWLKPGGEIIIGNFGPDNASRAFMEIFGDWHLEHRSHQQLTNLAVEAGFEAGQVWIGEEEEGINLFLHIKR